MFYRLPIRSQSGEKFFLFGKKIIKKGALTNLWRDTTTLYFTVYAGDNEHGAEVGEGVLHILPADFLKQLSTMQALNAQNKIEELRALIRFGVFFAGILYETYGSISIGRSAFNHQAEPRVKRRLKVSAPEVYFFSTTDGVELRLTRYSGGSKGPVMLSHGLGVSSEIFSTDTIDTNLLEYLWSAGYDVWLLDFRASIALDASNQQSDGDQVAHYDYPAAVAKIRQITQAQTIQCVVHCWGSTTFFMSMLSGKLSGVRSVVASQIAAHCYSPIDVRFKTGLYLPEFLRLLGIKSLTAYVAEHDNWFRKLYDIALVLPAMIFAQGLCRSETCHRITFMYGSLYRHEELNETLHSNLGELFGIANMRSFEHIGRISRAKSLVNFSGQDVYLPNLEELNLPIAFIHGASNHCFLPKTTAKTYQLLCDRFGPEKYSRHEISGYGHIDCIFGKNAARDVFPHILSHLDKT
jgi:cholesterol oxidase